MDGKLLEWSEAFCTPVHYSHRDLENRDRAAVLLHVGTTRRSTSACAVLGQEAGQPRRSCRATYNGDAVEFYLDTRPGDALRGKDWTPGAIHFFFSPFEGTAVKPRWVMRGGIATSDTKLEGVEVAATQNANGYEVEFKLPWANFPGFQPKLGAVLALDAELCSGDGATRTDRTFAYGSPLSVQQPASLGKVELVKSFDPDYFATIGPATFPMWVETPWTQPDRAQVQAIVAIPPAFIPIVGTVEIRLHDADGKVVKTLPARVEDFGPKDWGFERAVARWSIDDFAPNAYFATARVVTRTGKTLTTVTPRMVHEANISGR